MNRLGSAYTTRCELHVSKLREFADFCTGRGWVEEPPVGEYEVLRMRRKGNKIPLFVYRKAKVTEHYTVSGVALIMVAAYLKDKREQKDSHASSSPPSQPSIKVGVECETNPSWQERTNRANDGENPTERPPW